MTVFIISEIINGHLNKVKEEMKKVSSIFINMRPKEEVYVLKTNSVLVEKITLV